MDLSGQKAVEVLEGGRFAGATAAVEDEPRASRRECQLAFELADDIEPRHESLLGAVDRVAGTKDLCHGLPLHYSLRLVPLTLRDGEPLRRSGAELARQRLTEASDLVSEIFDLRPQHAC